jgi:2-polyprenyl-6-methoxyphenol hydroxylase-like FAD-dependent oxidoreductase
VKFAPPSDVVGLTGDDGKSRITGVRVLPRADDSAAQIHDADLVVDASGRNSRASVWLEALGYTRPPEERLRMDLRYTSQRFQLAPDALGGALVSLQAPTPSNPRAGVLARLEGNTWLLTLAGILGDRAPVDPAGLREFARSLPFPDIHDALCTGDAIAAPSTYRFAESVRRRYDQSKRVPGGFLPLGDSLCCFNPIYGQGMTVAALQALVLRRHLERSDALRTRRILRNFVRITETPWQMALAADLSLPGMGKKPSATQRLIGRYLSRLNAAAEQDAKLGTAFVRVSGLVDEPLALMRPAVAVRVFGRGG